MGINIRPMTSSDVPAVVRLHAGVFVGYRSTAMGAAYLKAVYHTLAENQSCVSVVACEGDDIVAWAGGVLDRDVYNKEIVQHCAVRAPFIVVSILKNRPTLLRPALTYAWNVLRGLVARRRRARRAGEPSVPGVGPPRHYSPSALFLVMGVDVRYRRRGLSQLIMADFHRRLLREGFKTCTGHTYADNEAIDKALRKAGYRLSRHGDGINHYEKKLAPERAD
jgi:ribosomal protein S18 acetylase RimI-like enzyme